MESIPVLEHDANRIIQLTRGLRPEMVPSILVQEAERQAGRNLSSLLKRGPEYGNGKLYPRLRQREDVLEFADSMYREYMALKSGNAVIVDDSLEEAKGLSCNVCGNYQSFADKFGCRLTRIQNRIGMSLIFEPEVEP